MDLWHKPSHLCCYEEEMEPLGFKKTDPENCPCNTKCDGFLLLDNSISSLMFSFEVLLLYFINFTFLSSNVLCNLLACLKFNNGFATYYVDKCCFSLICPTILHTHAHLCLCCSGNPLPTSYIHLQEESWSSVDNMSGTSSVGLGPWFAPEG
eukprot:TRINITY_DN19817_c2_g1_i1.p1 TRINITY_DN19817_c2_g1~~TRINITY_DN19817_c2_g1_i1.p1  ORF type:complete len:152 (+),score=13.87 TRINITY_DN19817_c2_g1_i1:624-1079(+)